MFDSTGAPIFWSGIDYDSRSVSVPSVLMLQDTTTPVGSRGRRLASLLPMGDDGM